MFMHIPKTAGTSLREAVEANFRPSQLLYLYPGPPGLPGYDIESLPVEQLSGTAPPSVTSASEYTRGCRIPTLGAPQPSATR